MKINIGSNTDLNSYNLPVNTNPIQGEEQIQPHETQIWLPSFKCDMSDDIMQDADIQCIIKNMAPIIYLYLDKIASEKEEANKGVNVSREPQKKDEDYYAVLVIDELLLQAKKLNRDFIYSETIAYRYNGVYYEQVNPEYLLKILEIAAINTGLEPLFASRNRFVQQLERQFRIGALKNPKVYTEKEVSINLQNGTVRFINGKFHFGKHRKEDFFTYVLPFCYDPQSTCPKFMKYLNEVMPDEVSQNVLKDYMGSLFVKSFRLAKILVCIGKGRNGKSLFFFIMTAVLGKQNVTNFTLEELCDKNGNARIQLENKILNYSDEMSRRFDQSIFKTLVAGGPITGKLLYKDMRLVNNYAKLAVSTNLFPEDIEASYGSLERYLFAYFGETIAKEKRNPNLGDEIISEECSGIFNWILEGVERIAKNKRFIESESSKAIYNEFKETVDVVLDFLKSDGYVKSETESIRLVDLFTQYKKFCDLNNFPIKGDSRSFVKNLSDKGFKTAERGKGGYKHVFIERIIDKEVRETGVFFKLNSNE